MKRLFTCILAAMGLHLAAAGGPAVDELLWGVPFRPCYMDGEFTALQRFSMRDLGRLKHENDPKSKTYLSGHDCFSMQFQDGVFTIRFDQGDKTPEEYFRNTVLLHNQSPIFLYWGTCPAPQYLVTCEYQLNRGKIGICNRVFRAGDGKWQKISIKLPENVHKYQESIKLYPEPGYAVSIRSYSIRPVYPEKKGAFIHLPGGGKLTAIQMPENASEDLRIALNVWRGWLWKITGTALPFKVVKKAAPEAGTLSAVPVRDVAEGWNVEADAKGIRLQYSDDRYVLPACSEYMRHNGVRLYSDDCRIIPEKDPARVLKAVKESFRPHFTYPGACYTSSNHFNQGYKAVYRTALGGSVNYYTAASHNEFHTWNTLLPYEKYGKTHPEYWMKLADGKYQQMKKGFFSTPCLSNSESRKIIIHNVIEAVKAMGPSCQSTELCLGDNPEFCHCDRCRAAVINGSITDLFLDLQKEIAEALKKAGLKTEVNFCAYHKYSMLPEKVRPAGNMSAHVCLTWRLMRCQLHVDCPINRPYLAQLKEWNRLFGGKDHVGYSLYFDERPYHFEKLLDFLGQYGRHYYFHYHACCDHVVAYFFGRWNNGRLTPESRRLFYQDYFGPGGKYVDEIYRMIEEYCRNCQHTKEEMESSNVISAIPLTNFFGYMTVLPRDMFEKAYALFARAAKLVPENSVQYRNILYHKYTLLTSDLCKYRRSSCKSQAELEQFADRLAEYIRIIRIIADPAKPASYGRGIYAFKFAYVKPRKWFETVAGLTIPETCKNWSDEPFIQDFLKNPRSFFKIGPARIAGGWHWAAHSMMGGAGAKPYHYQCPERVTNCISRASSGQGRIILPLELAETLDRPVFLAVDGLDDDKPGRSTFDVLVNGRKIYSGANTFPEHEWGRMTFHIPAGSLKAGNNAIEFVNTVPDQPSDKRIEIVKGAGGIAMGQVEKQNYERGWICISDVRIYDVNGELKKMFSGKESEWEVKHRGTVGNSHLQLAPEKVYLCGGRWPDPPKFNAAPSNRIRVKGEVEGTPYLSVGFDCILADTPGSSRKFASVSSGTAIRPNGKSVKFDKVLKIPPGTMRLMPAFSAPKGNRIILKSLTYEIVP